MKLKRISWLYLALALVLIVSMFAGLTGADKECEPELVVDLIAGQNMVVGTVSVTNDDEQVCVTYALDEDALAEGWLIYETHLAIANEKDGIPQTRGNRWGTNPIPGQFPYGDDELEGVEYYTECITFDELGFGICNEAYIAAHAVVKRFDRVATSATIYGNIGGYTGSGPQGDIYEIDPLEETETLFFDNPSTDFEANWYPNALAYDEDNDRLYYTTHKSKLVFYDLNDGEVKDADPDGIFVNDDNVLGAAFGDGYYWYIINRSNKLAKAAFDSDGMVTDVESIEMTNASALTQGDIVYDDGMIYGSSGTGAGGLRGFFTYDTSDPDSFTVLEEYEAGINGLQLAWGLDEDGEKVLYGCRGIRVDGEVVGSEWFTVNLENGEDTSIEYETENAYQDLASFIDYAETWESETAWGDGDRFNERGNWGMYFKYKICEPEPEPWIIYGIEFGGSGLYEISIENGTVTKEQLFATPRTNNNGLAFDRENQRLYYAAGSNLYFYDLEVGLETTAGSLPDGHVVFGACFGMGSYWYINNRTDDLYRVDFDGDGEIDTIDDTTHMAIAGGKEFGLGDIAMDKAETGIIYGSTSATYDDTEFFTYNVVSQEYEMITDESDNDAAVNLQIAFGLDGFLYGTVTRQSTWYVVDTEQGTRDLFYTGTQQFSDLARGQYQE